MSFKSRFSERVECSSMLSHPKWYYFGIWTACTTWWWLLDHIGRIESPLTDALGWQAIFGVQAVASLIFALYFMIRKPKAAPNPTGDLIATAAAIAAVLVIAIPSESISPEVRFILASILGGLFASWEYLRWGASMGWTGPFNIIAILCINGMLSPIAKTFLHGLPDIASSAIILLLPLVNLVAMRKLSGEVWSEKGPLPPKPISVVVNPQTRPFLIKLGICIATFSFVGSALIVMLNIGETVPLSDYLTWQGMRLLVSFLLFAWVFMFGKGFNFGILWKFVLLALCAALLLEVSGISLGMGDFIAMGFIDAIWTLIWAVLLDFAGKHAFNPAVVTSLGRSLYCAFFFVSALAFRFFGIGLSASAALILLTLVIFVVVFCADSQNRDMKALFFELSNTLPEIEDHTTIENLCKACSEPYGLTERETEIACHLAKGQSRDQIAEALFL
ncbi:MAG: hypothetical protein RR505_02390, partial [Raoultibacter sp.]